MDTRELETFVAVSETLNYKKAGERLRYAPSTVFKHIQNLEKEIGKLLLTRDGRGLSLTEEGNRFLPYAMRMLSDYYRAIGKTQEADPALTVGGCEMNIGNSLLEMLSGFGAARMHLRMSMVMGPNASVPEMVRSGQVDVGFYYSMGMNVPGVSVIRLFRDSAILVTSTRNPLSERKNLHYEDLNGMEFVYPHDSCCFVTMLMPELEKRGVSLSRVMYLGGMQMVVDRVRTQNSITLAPVCALRRFEEVYGLRRIDLQEEPMYAWETILLGRNAEKPAVQELVHFSLHEAGQFPADNITSIRTAAHPGHFSNG